MTVSACRSPAHSTSSGVSSWSRPSIWTSTTSPSTRPVRGVTARLMPSVPLKGCEAPSPAVVGEVDAEVVVATGSEPARTDSWSVSRTSAAVAAATTMTAGTATSARRRRRRRARRSAARVRRDAARSCRSADELAGRWGERAEALVEVVHGATPSIERPEEAVPAGGGLDEGRSAGRGPAAGGLAVLGGGSAGCASAAGLVAAMEGRRGQGWMARRGRPSAERRGVKGRRTAGRPPEERRRLEHRRVRGPVARRRGG